MRKKHANLMICGLLSSIFLILSSCSFVFDSGEQEATSPAQEMDVIEDTPTGQADIVDFANRFEEASLGFAVHYPENWIYEKPAEHIVIFSGPEGTEAYDATVNVQTLSFGEGYTVLEDLYQDFKQQIEGAGGQISDMGREDFIQDGVTYESIGFLAEYEDEVVFKQFIVAVSRGDGHLHQISYTAPEHLHDRYIDQAMFIMDSLVLLLDSESSQAEEGFVDSTADGESVEAGDIAETSEINAELRIVQDSLHVDHAFQNVYVELEVTNTGSRPISHVDSWSWSPLYQFVGILDEQVVMFYSDSRETVDGDLIPLGKREGVRIFEDIQPGQTKVLRYGLGGIVTSSQAGTAASENVFARYMEDGEHEGRFRIDLAVLAPEHQAMPGTITSANYHEYMDIINSTQTIDVHLASHEGSMANDSLPPPIDESLIQEWDFR